MRPRHIAVVSLLIAMPVVVALPVGHAHEGADAAVVSAPQHFFRVL